MGAQLVLLDGPHPGAAVALQAGPEPMTIGRDASRDVPIDDHGASRLHARIWLEGYLASFPGTLVFYMGVTTANRWVSWLLKAGKPADTPVAIIERGTTPLQRVIRGRLGQLTLLAEAHRVESPSMLIVGEVAALALSQYAGFSATETVMDYAQGQE